MSSFHTTIDTAEAAAFGTLGVTATLETTFIEAEGIRRTRFQLALQSLDGSVDTRRLRGLWKTGRLEATEPAHPLLTILRAYQVRRAYLAIQSGGSRYRHLPVPGTREAVWTYAPGNEGLPGCHGRGEVIRTDDLQAAAALSTVGLPLLMIEDGPRGRHFYHLPRYGPALPGGAPPVDAVALLTAWNADKDSLPWATPFAQAVRGLHNLARFHAAIREDIPVILFLKPHSTRSALVRSDASPAAFDQMKQHFDR